MFLFRPILAEPPLCSMADLRTTLTIDDLADLHEILDLKEELAHRAETTRKSRPRGQY